MKNWYWWLLVVAAVVAILWLFDRPDGVPQVQYVDREVTVTVPVEKVRTVVEVDTVIDIRVVKNTTDRYFYEKSLLQIDSLRKVIREYAAERGDTIEQVACADTVICFPDPQGDVCDTFRIQHSMLAGVLLVEHSPAPRRITVNERTLFIEKEVIPFSAKLEWGSYGAIFGAVLTYFATREE